MYPYWKAKIIPRNKFLRYSHSKARSISTTLPAITIFSLTTSATFKKINKIQIR
jgi:hypothetical protein